MGLGKPAHQRTGAAKKLGAAKQSGGSSLVRKNTITQRVDDLTKRMWELETKVGKLMAERGPKAVQ